MSLKNGERTTDTRKANSGSFRCSALQHFSMEGKWKTSFSLYSPFGFEVNPKKERQEESRHSEDERKEVEKLKRHVVIVAAVLLMLLETGYTYADNEHTAYLKSAVSACEHKVQQTVERDFSAYVRNDSQINWLGTAKAVFEFKKCMASIGIDVDETSKPQNR